jgi:hypothetical protein
MSSWAKIDVKLVSSCFYSSATLTVALHTQIGVFITLLPCRNAFLFFDFSGDGSVFLFSPGCYVCCVISHQAGIKEQMDMERFPFRPERKAVYCPAVVAEEFFISRYGGRHPTFYKGNLNLSQKLVI